MCLGFFLAHCLVFECVPGKGIDAQEILAGKGLSSDLLLIQILQQWSRADFLWNWPQGAVRGFVH